MAAQAAVLQRPRPLGQQRQQPAVPHRRDGRVGGGDQGAERVDVGQVAGSAARRAATHSRVGARARGAADAREPGRRG